MYPVVAGIPILLKKPEDYLLDHAKGVAPFASPPELPPSIRREFSALARESARNTGFFEEDLESERVIALYAATHYLSTQSHPRWWRKDSKDFNAVIDRTIREIWDQGPLAKVQTFAREAPGQTLVEFGCGVGGVARFFDRPDRFYLGLDTSFVSLQWARRLYGLAPPPRGARAEFCFRIPGDLLQGEFEREVRMPLVSLRGSAFFCVADIEDAPLRTGVFDGAVSLNTIDMLDLPERLPQAQVRVTRPGGWVVGASPMVWQPKIAQGLRKRLGVRTSTEVFTGLYQDAGVILGETHSHLPWVFFKHERQIEIYSVDFLVGTR